MAWTKATIEIKPASVGTGIKVSLKKTNKSSARMTFTISGSTGQQIGWADGDKIEVMIGEGEHHGLIRVRKNKSVGEATLSHREMAKGAWFTLKIGHQPAFVDRSEASAWCQWEKVEDGWIEIVLPKWADETAPNRRKPVEGPMPPSGGTSGQPARRGADVTAALMGDPPPGRREMLKKVGKIAAE